MADLQFELGDGHKIPGIGFGTFQIPEDAAEVAAGLALKVGYRHLDTAEFYQNEGGVGRAIGASGLPRSEIFVTTKLDPGNPAWGQTVKTYETTIAACEESVAKLGVGQVDLYLIHTPMSGKDARLEQYRALVECQAKGLCRSIGVSNYDVQHLRDIEDAGMPMPAANQIELHPLCQKVALLEYMRSKNILPIAYSSLAPLSTWREGYSAYGGSKRAEAKVTPPTIADVAVRVGVSEPRLLLRYALQKGWAVLPKSVREERMQHNFDLGFAISDEAMKELDAMESDAAFAFGQEGAALDPTKVE